MSFTSDTYINQTGTGLYYLGSRIYSPEIGRVICPDKISLLEAEPMKLTSKNLYAYCDNNPVSKSDLNGEIAIAAIGVVVAKATGDDYTLRDAVFAGAIGATSVHGGTFAAIGRVVDVAYNAYLGWEDSGNVRVGLCAGLMAILSNAFDVEEVLKLVGLGANIDDFISKAMIGFEYGIVSNTTSSYATKVYEEESAKQAELRRYIHLYTVKEEQMTHLY